MTPMLAAAYLRVSSAAQRDRVTIESQRREVPAWIGAQGWQLVETYEDDGRSAAAGKLEARTGYARMLADARAGRFAVVVVYAVDRLTRSEDQVERAQVVADISKAGCKIAVVGAGIQDPGTFAGDAYLSLQALFAAEWLRRHRERVVAGHITAAQRGRKPRGSTPFGLRYDRATGAWSTDPGEALIVREVFERIAANERVQHISDDLDRRRIARPYEGRWFPSSVRDMVHSDVYVGRYVVDVDRGLAVPVPPIVDADLAAIARGALLGRYRKVEARTRHFPLLAGLAACALCHARVGIGTTSMLPAVRYVDTYRCLHRRRRPRAGEVRCDLPLVLMAETDARVWGAVVDVVSDARVIDRAMAQRRPGEPGADPAESRAEPERLDGAQASVLAQLADGAIGQATADATIARLAARRRTAQVALSDALAAARGLRSTTEADALAATLDKFRRGVETFSPEERRGFLRAAVATAVMSPTAVDLDMAIDVRSFGHGHDAVNWTSPRVRLPTLRVATALPTRRTA